MSRACVLVRYLLRAIALRLRSRLLFCSLLQRSLFLYFLQRCFDQTPESLMQLLDCFELIHVIDECGGVSILE